MRKKNRKCKYLYSSLNYNEPIVFYGKKPTPSQKVLADNLFDLLDQMEAILGIKKRIEKSGREELECDDYGI